jgi:oligopeptide/dipeptide ABC transporter ATP-binding protein
MGGDGPREPARPVLSRVWTAAEPLVEVRGLIKDFPAGAGLLGRGARRTVALDGIDLAIMQGETLGLTGAAGAGKSTLVRAILRLHEPAAGKVFFHGLDLTALGGSGLRRFRGEMALLFEDPSSALNPNRSVAAALAEPLDVHHVAGGAARQSRIEELLRLVGLQPGIGSRYPHQLSPEHRQRVAIARALALQPSFVACDEPTSMLDPASATRILDLLRGLRDQLHLTYLFVSRDPGIIQAVSDRVAVMYRGRVVEVAPTQRLFREPKHPYSGLLLAESSAEPTRRGRPKLVSAGGQEPPGSASGCRFRSNCFKAQPKCAERVPSLDEFSRGEHRAACFFPLEGSQLQ